MLQNYISKCDLVSKQTATFSKSRYYSTMELCNPVLNISKGLFKMMGAVSGNLGILKINIMYLPTADKQRLVFEDIPPRKLMEFQYP